MAINLVWLKRDLRIQDHAPLKTAIDSGEPFAVLYIFEPEAEQHYDFDLRHWQFIYGSLKDISETIPITIAYGNALEVLNEIHESYEVKNLYSHEETGVMWTYERDKSVSDFCRNNNIKWSEYQTNGVVRGLRNRNGWDAAWIKHMSQKPLKVIVNKDDIVLLDLPNLPIHLEEKKKECKYLAPGPKNAKVCLDEFINEKVEDYFKNISLPENQDITALGLAPICHGEI